MEDTYDETITWHTFRVGETTLRCAVVGMAVVGDSTQILVADELDVVYSVVRRTGGDYDWTNPPNDKSRVAIEEHLEKIYPREASYCPHCGRRFTDGQDDNGQAWDEHVPECSKAHGHM